VLFKWLAAVFEQKLCPFYFWPRLPRIMGKKKKKKRKEKEESLVNKKKV
jgi:hypothetical protein